MPFRSEKQRRFLWAVHPEIAKKWTDEHGSKIVSIRKKKKKRLEECFDDVLIIESEDMYSGLHLSDSEKDIMHVKKKLVKGNKVIGVPVNTWEENMIKKTYPSFYKKRVTKVRHDKKGLPIDPYVWLPKSS